MCLLISPGGYYYIRPVVFVCVCVLRLKCETHTNTGTCSRNSQKIKQTFEREKIPRIIIHRTLCSLNLFRFQENNFAFDQEIFLCLLCPDDCPPFALLFRNKFLERNLPLKTWAYFRVELTKRFSVLTLHHFTSCTMSRWDLDSYCFRPYPFPKNYTSPSLSKHDRIWRLGYKLNSCLWAMLMFAARAFTMLFCTICMHISPVISNYRNYLMMFLRFGRHRLLLLDGKNSLPSSLYPEPERCLSHKIFTAYSVGNFMLVQGQIL